MFFFKVQLNIFQWSLTVHCSHWLLEIKQLSPFDTGVSLHKKPKNNIFPLANTDTVEKKNTQLKEQAQGEMNKLYLLSTISKCNTKLQIALEQSKASDDKTLIYMNENHHWAINIKN